MLSLFLVIALFGSLTVKAIKICDTIKVNGIRTMKCSSQITCYANREFDSSPCLEGEVCAYWTAGNYWYNGCLMKSYCDKTGRYEYFKGYFYETLFTCPPEPECSIITASKFFAKCPEGKYCAFNGFASTCVAASVCGTDYITHNKVLGKYVCNPDPNTNEVIPEEPEITPIPRIDNAFDVDRDFSDETVEAEIPDEEFVEAITMQAKIHCAFFLMLF